MSALAEYLELTQDQLEELSLELHENTGSSNDCAYSYYFYVPEDTPPDILEKMDWKPGDLINDIPLSIVEDVPVIDEELRWEIHNTDQLAIFHSHLIAVDELLDSEFNPEINFSLLVMLHAHIISSTEHFLATTFISTVLSSENLTRKVVETDPELANQKFSLKEIFDRHEKIEQTVASHLKGIIFHNIGKVSKMYSMVLGYEFGAVDWLYHAISLRHHCSHRAGYDKEGVPVQINCLTVKDLANRCIQLCEDIDSFILAIYQK